MSQQYSNPCTDQDRPSGFQEVKAPRLQEGRHTQAVTLLALRIGRLYPPENIPDTHFCWKLRRSQGHSADEDWANSK
jgi:hypothetical protein